MANIKIKFQNKSTEADLQLWKQWMMEPVKCMNKFCYGTYNDEDLICAHVINENTGRKYLVPLCKDCCKSNNRLGLLVNESKLISEPLTAK